MPAGQWRFKMLLLKNFQPFNPEFRQKCGLRLAEFASILSYTYRMQKMFFHKKANFT